MFMFNEDLESFVQQVIPKDAGEIQKREMRAAFTAGAKVAAHRLVKSCDGIDKDRYIENIDEMFEFYIQEIQK